MTKTLILGGTGWLGREFATQLVANGDEVACLARGESGAAAEAARLVRADRTGANAYRSVSAEPWDDVIEISAEPSFVDGALAELSSAASQWTFVSTASVYADHGPRRAGHRRAGCRRVDHRKRT